jgi:hypothetical protein
MFSATLRSEINPGDTTLNEFVAGMLWYVDKDITSRPSSESVNFPSWSWLSVDGVIFNDSAGEVHENSTLSIREFIKPTVTGNENNKDDRNTFAAGVQGLKLRVSGKLRTARGKEVPDQFYFSCFGGVNALCSSPPGYRNKELLDLRELQKCNGRYPQWWHRLKGRIEYLEMIDPISNDTEMGPKAHILQTPEGRPIGWMLPDTTDVLPEEIYCLQIWLEPVKPADKYKLINTWVVRGLALKLVENQSGTTFPMFSRIGYFELSQKHNGFLYPDLAFIRKFQSAD